MPEVNLLEQDFIIFFNSPPVKNNSVSVNNHFVFHRTSAVDIQSIVYLLQPIHDFLTCGKKVRSSVNLFLIV